ncbi:hypothetical protein [Lysobacter enzymogenes]|uniref:hypothetical protein n=1 Tax=Lysobacter enzymogenes TaxID=69 RepID=UPI001A97214F|nr:hypothetical protein [Lysobacter enzymogenes]QQP98179.1 hypothetical protein JHW38_09385 [Lysobacter enzymogenes]
MHSISSGKGFFYFEALDGEIVRHASVFGSGYSWARLKNSYPPDYLFTCDPSFDGPMNGDESISEEEFELIWRKAGGPL